MKKWKIFLVIIAVILAIIAGLVWWQFNNIKAVYYSFKYNNEDIDQLITKHNDEVDKYIREHGSYNVRPSTDSEQQLHHVGLINDGEFVNILTGETSVGEMFGTNVEIDENKNFVDSSGQTVTKEELETAKKENASSAPPEEQAPEAGEEKPAQSDKTSQYIAQMYVLKSSFTSRLDGLFNEAKAYYASMSPEQKENAKTALLDRFYSRATALEAECDGKVDAVLSELDAELTATGGDKSIITKIRNAYTQEKSLKKAYYLNLAK